MAVSTFVAALGGFFLSPPLGAWADATRLVTKSVVVRPPVTSARRQTKTDLGRNGRDVFFILIIFHVETGGIMDYYFSAQHRMMM
jgi:hypothetical protein